MTRQNTGRRYHDKKWFKSVWLLYAFMAGYIIAVAGIDLDIFGEMGKEVNEFITKCGGVATVSVIIMVVKMILDRKKDNDN